MCMCEGEKKGEIYMTKKSLQSPCPKNAHILGTRGVPKPDAPPPPNTETHTAIQSG
jgi:hypothetical protein